MPIGRHAAILVLLYAAIGLGATTSYAQTGIIGHVSDLQDKAVSGAVVRLTGSSVLLEAFTDKQGRYEFGSVTPGAYNIFVDAPGFETISQRIELLPGELAIREIRFERLSMRNEAVTIEGKTAEPALDLRNSAVFEKTLFSRDDQILQQLDAGVNAGQHEGGGKSLEIRRFGFNLDHGGVNGGLKVLVDNVPQNQGTQGHGQGYLGSLKSVTPELIEGVTIVNGPFRAEYGDFSGLGVVHLRQRETLPDQYTVRLQGGQFGTRRVFTGFSPDVLKTDAYLAYEGAYTDGPFLNPGRYRRDNMNGNYSKSFGDNQKLGFRTLLARNNFYSSGQIPLDLVANGTIDRFGYLDPTHGGRAKLGTFSGYYQRALARGASLRVDGFLARSLFDLFSNFTYFLNDPVNGDGIQQHDSRYQEGVNAQYSSPHTLGRMSAIFTAGGNFHDNQINVGLYPRQGRVPGDPTTKVNAHVTNAAGYAQESFTLGKHWLVGAGVRYDEFRYGLRDRLDPLQSGAEWAGRWQGKGFATYTPSRHVPLSFHLNYGRGMNSADARGVIQRPDRPRLATTDFYQAGAAWNAGGLSLVADTFLIDHSNEQVYIPDDGTIEFKGPTRAYGYEGKASFHINRYVSFNAGLTKVSNAFYRGGDYRVYIDSAPHLVANAALTVGGWHGWSGSVRMRAINHYRLDGADPSIRATGNTVSDLSAAKALNRHVELNFGLENFTNRAYYETQNYFESRVSPNAPVIARIHGTPGYPITAIAGVTFRFGGK